MATQLNRVYYDVAKALLGLPPSASFGAGGHVRAFLETRLLTRAAAKVATRIITAWARVLLLPQDSPVAPAIRAALAAGGGTWLQDAAAVAQTYGVSAPPLHLADAAEAGPKARRQAVRSWARAAVLPKIREAERAWFCEQLGKLNDNGLLPIAEVLPLQRQWPADLRWAGWGKSTWRFHRAWCVARVTSEIPADVWGMPQTRLPQICALCAGAPNTLEHLLAQCPAGRGLRDAVCERWPLGPDTLTAWVLRDVDALDERAAKVRYLGLLTAALVHACGSAGQAA